MKVELVYKHFYQTCSEAAWSISEYIEIFYHRQRMHWALEFLSLNALETSIDQSLTIAPTAEPSVH
jgi:Integrase core domain